VSHGKVKQFRFGVRRAPITAKRATNSCLAGFGHHISRQATNALQSGDGAPAVARL
jgi:hypothetical protein